MIKRIIRIFLLLVGAVIKFVTLDLKDGFELFCEFGITLCELFVGEGLLESRMNRKKLLKGSERYYEQLIRSAKFGSITISDKIMCGFSDDDSDLYSYMKSEWEKGASSNVLLTGEGGMGKTVSMLHMWGSLLNNDEKDKEDKKDKKDKSDKKAEAKKKSKDKTKDEKKKTKLQTVPVYIQLNEYNAYSKENSGRSFICDRINDKYLFDDSEEDKHLAKAEMYRFLNRKTKKDQKEPSVILLLDGFNEVTAEDKIPLIDEIKDIIHNYGNIRLIISSRYDMRSNHGWMEDFSHYDLAPLTRLQVQQYLSEYDVEVPTDPKTVDLISNPMMLTLYAKTGGVSDTNSRIETCGELIRAYIESQIRNERMNSESDVAEQKVFLIKYVLPYIAYRMELSGAYFLKYDELLNVVNEAYNSEFNHMRYANILSADFGSGYKALLSLGNKEKDLAEHRIYTLENEISMLSKSENGFTGTYSFQHQNYRDYFSSRYIVNDMRAASDDKNDIALSMEIRVLPRFIVKMLGEAEGEHHFIRSISDGTYVFKKDESIFALYIEKFRGRFDKEKELAVRNLIEIWKTSRGELSGIDFSYLNLSDCIFNNVICGRGRKMGADFIGAKIDFSSFLPQGHVQWVYNVSYFNDDKMCISASRDGYIKEWNLDSGACVYSFKIDAEVIRAFHMNDDRHIIAVTSDDKAIYIDKNGGSVIKTEKLSSKPVEVKFFPLKEKMYIALSEGRAISCDTKSFLFEDVCSFGEAICSMDITRSVSRMIAGSKSGKIFGADLTDGEVYLIGKASERAVTKIAFGKKDIAAIVTDDYVIREIDTDDMTETGRYEGHTSVINSICYNKDYTCLLSTSDDDIIKEWSCSDHISNNFNLHYDSVFCAVYNSDCKKILSSSRDFSIRQWDVSSGEMTLSIVGLSYFTRSTRFSDDGNKILVSSCDGTVREFDSATGKCINTYLGHTDRVYRAVYNSDNTRILSASLDKGVYEWEVGKCDSFDVCSSHEKCADCAVYLDDGRVISISADGVIRHSEKISGAWESKLHPATQMYIPKEQNGVTETVGTNAICCEDGVSYFVSYWDGTIARYNKNTNELMRSFRKHTNWVYCCVLASDGATMYSVSKDGTVAKWKAESGEALCESVNVGKGSIYSAELDEQKREILISTTKNVAVILDMDSLAEKYVLEGHGGRVFSASYSRDKKRIVTMSEDGTIRIWEFKDTWQEAFIFNNIMGIIINGCDFTDMQDKLTPAEKGIIRQYGGTV